jgi:hypothetical protein
MKIFATTAIQTPGVETYMPLFAQLAGKDKFGTHSLCDDAEAADAILFLDGHQHYQDMELTAIRQHPLVIKHREKAFVYSEVDQPWCAMPGLYVSMPKNALEPQRQRACAYISLPNASAAPSPLPAEADALLFSFMGRGGNRTRDRLLRLKHPRAHVEDTSNSDFFGAHDEKIEKQKQRYSEVISRSKFVLCPKGAGTSSFRIFETLSAGRVPVILSDEWAPPAGPDWARISVTVPEANIERVGAVIEGVEQQFPAMAVAARNAWEEFFAPEVKFHRMVDALSHIMSKRTAPESELCRKVTGRYLRLKARETKARIRGLLRV